MTPNTPSPSKFPKWILVPIGLVCALFLFLAIWQFLTPAERKVPVAFSDFIAEVHAGRVDEIKIHDREYTFRTRDSAGGNRSVVKETIGPIADQAMVASLEPDDPAKPLPKIYFER